MTHHTRVQGESLEQRVWWHLYERDTPLKGFQVAEEMSVGYWPTIQALMRLLQKGSIERVGGRYHGAYIATGPRPEDRRGLSPGSVKAFADRWDKPVKETKVLPSPLSQALAWEPKQPYCRSRVDKIQENRSNNGGAVRPEEAEAAR